MFVVKITTTVRSEIPGGDMVLDKGEIAEAERNQHGAVSAITLAGKRLGLKSGEYEIIRDDEASGCPQCKLLQDTLSARVGGERLGDTLIRLGGHIVRTEKNRYVSTEDWREWLTDVGQRLNEAAGKEA